MKYPKPFRDLREFMNTLRENRELIEIQTPVDPTLEIAEIHRRVIADGGPALLFRNVKGSPFPVVTNLFGTRERVDLAFRNAPHAHIEKLVALATREFPPSISKLWESRRTLKTLLSLGLKRRKKGAVTEQKIQPANLDLLPMLKSWPDDGGHFLTLPLVYTEDPQDQGSPANLGMYRIQRHSSNICGLHWQIGKGGGYHHASAEKARLPLPVSIFLGGPPALMLSAITPLPERVPELLFCSLLQEGSLEVSSAAERELGHPHPLISQCEFAIIGEAPPHERKPEGPFGDHYGYYSLEHPFPFMHCKAIYHRKDPIYPATVVGKPRQEDYYLGNYLQEMLSPLFPVVMPGVKSLWSYGETGFHSLGAAVVAERFGRECMTHAFRILGEGQLSLTKFLLLTDQPVDVRSIRSVLRCILERMRPERDLFIFSNLCLDTLDYTGPTLNEGSRGVMLGMGEPVRNLPERFYGTLPKGISHAVAFTAGCLVVELSDAEGQLDFEKLLAAPQLDEWPLIVVVDDVNDTVKSDESFLWTVFTRFEPAADIHARRTSVHRHHLVYQLPLLIDARMKSTYPDVVTCDSDTEALVTKRWNEYFN
ncbi:MAG: UbiD family decarboxylase [Chlamydiia bacterium]|nr:UbiD family decarboxylase [Chlamydiia bacterium]